MAADLYLYEFLYRGRGPASNAPPAYHVILAQDTRDATGAVTTATGPALTPEQAAANGFPLSSIVEGLNAQALADAANARNGVSELQGRLNEALAEVERLRAALGPEEADTISDRQFAQALADMGIITREEALAFVRRGEVPQKLQSEIDAIPDADERFAVDMQVSGATAYQRHHPSTRSLAQALGWSDPQMDALWAMARSLK